MILKAAVKFPIPHLRTEHQRTSPSKTVMIIVMIQCGILKLVSAIFCQIFIFSPNDSPSKTMKNAFYFI